MTFRSTWKALANRQLGGVQKEDVAAFVKTLYSAGLTAARDEALRDERQELLAVLDLAKPIPSNEIRTRTRSVADRSMTLLRLLQSQGAQ